MVTSSKQRTAGPGTRGWLVRAAQLLGLCGLAVAQPILDLLSDNAEFFTSRGSEGLDVVVFAAGLTVVPPLVLLGVEVLAGLIDDRAGEAVHYVFVAALVALLALNVLNDADGLPGGLLLLVAAGAGALAAVAVRTTRAAAMLATALAPAPLLFVALFLSSPGISAVFASETRGRAAEESRDVRVVMVVLDEFPTNLLLRAPGRIDTRRFPNFARLARTSTWYPNATGAADETSAAVPAILTGRYPPPGSVPTSAQHPDSLFSLLARTHRMNVHEEITRLCPESVCGVNREDFAGRMGSLISDGWVVYRRLVLPAGLRRGLPDITTGWKDFGRAESVPAPTADDLAAATGSGRAARFGEFLASIRPGDRPTLDFAHVLLPHVPWAYLPSGRLYPHSQYIPGLSADYRWTGDPGARFSAYQRMFLQARYVDDLLGRLLRRLRRTRVFDRAAVVVVADHGASMRPGDFRRRFTPTNVGGLAPVPLFIKEPRQRSGRTITNHVRTLDVLPTIADLLGSSLPWRPDGRSLAGSGYPEPARLTLRRVFGGAEVVTGVDALERQRSAVLATQLELFGTGTAFPGLGGPGRREALIGRSVRDVGVRSGGDRLVVANPEEYRDVQSARGSVPAFVSGGAPDLGRGEQTEVAIAVNGRVAAVGATFDLDDGQAFAIMLPASAFRPGANDVRAYEVAPDGASLARPGG